MYKTF